VIEEVENEMVETVIIPCIHEVFHTEEEEFMTPPESPRPISKRKDKRKHHHHHCDKRRHLIGKIGI